MAGMTDLRADLPKAIELASDWVLVSQNVIFDDADRAAMRTAVEKYLADAGPAATHDGFILALRDAANLRIELHERTA